MRLQRILTIIFAKLISKIIRKLTHKRGNTFPGYVARLIDPGILSSLSGMVGEKIIVTMGTNGKTTVNSLLVHALTMEGKKVLSNVTGANMLNGVTSAFVLAANRKGTLDADYACIEVDELAAMQILPLLQPDCILLTNIFRDQLDRFGEVDITFDRIQKAIETVPNAKLIINCDDSLSAALAAHCSNPVITYGINEQIFDRASRSLIRESIFCRFCGEKLNYDFFHYGQLGYYHCPCCGWERPAQDYTAQDVLLRQQGYAFDLDNIHMDSHADCPYNVYNTLSAYAVLCAMDAPIKHFSAAVNTFDYSNNREGYFTINGACVQLHLAKNPVGFQQKVSLIQRDRMPKDIIIGINDHSQDGKDLSWLWDVDLTYLKTAHATSITTVGKRCHDVALRLKYEDIPCNSSKHLKHLLQRLAIHGTGNIYLIVNYSGLLPANRLLHQLQKM